MAQIELWYKQDLKKPVQVQVVRGNVFSQDAEANILGVEVYDNGEEATLSGTVSANIIRPDGGTVAATGSFSGNKAQVALPSAAYAYPGQIVVALKITSSSVTTTLLALTATVYRTSTDTVVDPGTVVSSIQDLISAIETAVASIPADYSSLWATLAPAYTDLTFPVKRGQYCTYSGVLKRAKQDLESESWTSSHWANANIGEDLADIRINALPLNSGNAVTIPDASNINSYLTPGSFKVTTAEHAATMLGDPPTKTSGYRLYVMETSQANRVYQIAFINGKVRPRLRYYNGSSWNKWWDLAWTDDTCGRFRIMQYNIGKFNMGQPIGDSRTTYYLTSENWPTILANYRNLLGEYQPDIIGMQEFEDSILIKGENGASDETVSTNSLIFNKLYGNSDAYTNLTSKTCIKSKHNLSESSHENIQWEYTINGTTYTGNTRVIYSRVRFNGKLIPVLTCPFPNSKDEFSDAENLVMKKAAYQAAVNFIATAEGITQGDTSTVAFIVCDTNATPDVFLDSIMTDVLAPAGYSQAMGDYFPYQTTFQSYQYPERTNKIDNIFYRGDVHLSNFKVLWSERANLASDHCPVYADFMIG